MAYQALYRKWRPAVFDDVVGQGHITKTLKNQLETGKISHAYLFCGTRGTGKTTVAKILSKAVNCKNPKNGSPCNECSVCKGIADGSIMDVFEIDAASNNGVDNIREIIEDSKYVATEATYRVYIIDEVHMLSGGAFNALLKTLEEPPEHVIFILATTEAHKVPQTILSRCQRFDFKRINSNDIIRRMREIAMGEGLSITDDAYTLLAQLADGSMRDGLSVLERCISESGTSVTYETVTQALGISGSTALFSMADAVNEQNSGKILEIIDRIMSDGKDLHNFINDLINHYRNLMVCQVTENAESLLDCDSEALVKLKAQAKRTSFEKLSDAISLLSTAKNDAKWTKDPRVIYELALIKLTKPQYNTSLDAILDRLKECEDKIAKGITVQVKKEEPKEEVAPKRQPKTPSARLFVPVDVSALSQESPTVLAARRFDKIARQISRKYPFLAAVVMDRKVTIDGEGLILIFEKNETISKEVAFAHRREIEEVIEQAIGTEVLVKTAYYEDIEDNIIDFWKIGEKVTQNIENSIENLDELYPEIVDDVDKSEFIEYSPEKDNFTQVEIENDDSDDDADDDSEEFLEANEIEEDE